MKSARDAEREKKEETKDEKKVGPVERINGIRTPANTKACDEYRAQLARRAAHVPSMQGPRFVATGGTTPNGKKAYTDAHQAFKAQREKREADAQA